MRFAVERLHGLQHLVFGERLMRTLRQAVKKLRAITFLDET